MTPAGLEAAINASDARLTALRATLANRTADLPLRYWRQQAHLTVPATREIAGKALARGTAPMARILDRFEVEPAALADRLGIAPEAVQQLLEEPRSAPVVVIDGEDALAPGEAAAMQARADTIEALSVPGEVAGLPSLRSYRPPGLALGTTAREVCSLLWGLVERHGPAALPLDAIVFPKLDHPEEVDLVHAMLSDAERQLGITVGTIRTAILVESAACLDQLDRIAVRASDRLCALIFGLADYSADLGLPTIANDHMLADWARARMINVAAAVGVPALDGMRLAYPVSDPALSAEDDRDRFLERMALVYDDAVRAHAIGMHGKWVGHPAQLFAVLLAFEASFTTEAMEREAAKLQTYAASIHENGVGVTVIDGVMSDRATDRHARVLLRQAVATGRFDPARAMRLGVINATELAAISGNEDPHGG